MKRRKPSLATGWLCLALGMLTACGDDTSAEADPNELMLVVVDRAGHPSSAHCTVMPVLLGGRARDELDVAGEFGIVVDATPDLVTVSFVGVKDAANTDLSIEVPELTSAFRERIAIETIRSRHFVVELSGGCQP